MLLDPLFSCFRGIFQINRMKGIGMVKSKAKRWYCVLLVCSLLLGSVSADNSLTLIEQQDRCIQYEKKEIRAKRNISKVTGLKSKEAFQPILVELCNENAGAGTTMPKGIGKASVVYEYQTNTNGTMGLCALFQDEIPESAGPVGYATVGGLMVQDEWDCAYVYHDIPDSEKNPELALSIQNWIAENGLHGEHMLYPANVGSFKEWKYCFTEDQSVMTNQRQYVDLNGIRQLANGYGLQPAGFHAGFLKGKSCSGEIPVSEVDIRVSSRTFTSGFVYDATSQQYRRYFGTGTAYGDAGTGEQLTVSNVIIQRVEYITSGGHMAPVTVGRGNADIFMLGTYIEGYWARDDSNDQTWFFDGDGKPLELVPGVTFISLQSPSTAVVIMNY